MMAITENMFPKICYFVGNVDGNQAGTASVFVSNCNTIVCGLNGRKVMAWIL
jgi:hypothetical protein